MSRPHPNRPLRRGTRMLPVVAALPLLVGWSFFDAFHKHVEKGNEKAESETPAEALPHYDEAARLDPSSPVPDFNRGIALSKEGDGEAARDAFLGAAASESPEIAADALYNLGNVLLEDQEFAPAIEAYLKSLDIDPDDPDARRNLEIAVQRLEEQQQQQQQDQNQEQDQEGDENQQEQQQPSDDENEQEDSQDEQQQQQEGDEEPPQPEEGPPEERLTREQAERLLNAIESDELKVLEQLQESEEKAKGVVKNDW